MPFSFLYHVINNSLGHPITTWRTTPAEGAPAVEDEDFEDEENNSDDGGNGDSGDDSGNGDSGDDGNNNDNN